MKNVTVLKMWRDYAKRIANGGATVQMIAHQLNKNNKHRQVFRVHGTEVRCNGVLIYADDRKPVEQAQPEASAAPAMLSVTSAVQESGGSGE